MHGLVFTYVQKFVQKEFGNDVWKALIANAGVGGKSYSPAKSYPDEDAVAIVAAAAKLLELPAQEVLTTIGRGIAPESVGGIFERFRRVDASRSRHTGGAGLGLAIVKQTVEAHGGTIAVTSEVGKGTVFVVRLPKA